MIYGLYISAAGLRVNDMQQATQTNNLANVQTAGFKPDRVLVAARPMAVEREHPGSKSAVIPSLAGLGGGVWTTGSVVEFNAGSLERTGSKLDIALDTGPRADGFLGIAGDEGETCWTRDGRMATDATGRLVQQTTGLAVLDRDGEPIVLDPAGGEVSIDRTGAVFQGGGRVAQLRLASFDDPHRLAKRGAGHFTAPSGAEPRDFRGVALQGYVESAAVDPTRMLADMIATQRAYEANANLIRYQDETLGRAVNDLARIA